MFEADDVRVAAHRRVARIGRSCDGGAQDGGPGGEAPVELATTGRESAGHLYGFMIWVTRTKTTIEIDDRLLERAKRHAAARGTTLRVVVEEALRARLAPRPEAVPRYRFAPPTVRGTRQPAVDVADRNALYDLLDDRR
jgi:Arc/MetJ family transcription regulator